jgi:hypothetical protein
MQLEDALGNGLVRLIENLSQNILVQYSATRSEESLGMRWDQQ